MFSALLTTLKSRAAVLLRYEWLFLLFLAPFLVFPTVRPTMTLVALLLLVFLWLIRLWAQGEAWPVTPVNLPLLLLAVGVFVGALVSPFPDLTLPKLTNLILGFAAFRVTVWNVKDTRAARNAIFLVVLLGASLVTVGTLSAFWGMKVPALRPWLAHLPRALVKLPELSEQRGVNPNQLGGILSFYIPFTSTLAATKLAESRRLRLTWGRSIISAGLVILLIEAIIVLILTQSRSGWFGTFAGLLFLAIMLVLHQRPNNMALSIFLLSIGLAVFITIRHVIYLNITDRWVLYTNFGRINIGDRLEIWSKAIYAIQDFGVTGAGLGTYRRIVSRFYPYIRIPPWVVVYHAHNVFLQVWYDTGSVGIIAYLALLTLVLKIGVHLRKYENLARAIALATISGFVGFHVYGISDTLALGSKPTILFWLALALLVAVYVNCEPLKHEGT